MIQEKLARRAVARDLRLDEGTVEGRRRALCVERSLEGEGGRRRAFFVKLLQAVGRLAHARYMVVRHPPRYIVGEFRGGEPFVTKPKGFAVQVRIGKGVNRLQIAPQREGVGQMAVQVLGDEGRADRNAPAMPSGFRVEIGAVDEPIASLYHLVDRWHPV